MAKIVVCVLLIGFACVGQIPAQQVIVAHDDSAAPAAAPKKQSTSPASVAQASTKEYPKALPTKEAVKPAEADKSNSEPALVMIARAPGAKAAASPRVPALARPPSSTKAVTSATTSVASAPTGSGKPAVNLPVAHTMRLTRVEGPPSEPHNQLPLGPHPSTTRVLTAPLETAFVKLADGFDFPIGKPDAQGYYKARGFRSHGHLGEDWDGIRGGDTDLRDPIYCIGDGIVVFARDCHMGWGNVIIVRHSYRENGIVRNVDSFYGHLDQMLVRRGQVVSRGQQIATMGNAHGLYDAHLHLELRKNIEIGMSRAKFAQDSSNYYDPTQFINTHRHLQGGGSSYRVAMNTFVQDSRINWAAVRDYSHSRHRGGTAQSAAALKKAVAKKN